jgi:phthalate 4,5-dioxygenase oxygenase subunit
MQAEQNELITRIGPGTACGALMRHYWQPAALLDEFDPRWDPRMAERPVKAVRLLGQDLVLFRDQAGRWGLIDRDCPHRGADLAYGRHEGDGLRCPFHGWKFATDGTCLETPAEPYGSTLCQRVRQRSYPVREQAGVLFAWLGPEDGTPPELPAFDAFAPGQPQLRLQGPVALQLAAGLRGRHRPAHASYLHRFLQDASTDHAYGRQFRGASVGQVQGERWPMTKVLREFARPEIRHEALAPASPG